MKKYAGTKIVQAEPMMLGEYINNCIGDHIYNPYLTSPEQHLLDESGYRVVHEDGQILWSSAKVFEKVYKPIETFIERLEIECNELYDKFNKLQNFINSDAFEKLDNENRNLLNYQECIMAEYYSLLCKRLELAKQNNPTHNHESN